MITLTQMGTYTTRFLAAILQYKNTPDRDAKLSPAELVFDHQVNWFLQSVK